MSWGCFCTLKENIRQQGGSKRSLCSCSWGTAPGDPHVLVTPRVTGAGRAPAPCRVATATGNKVSPFTKISVSGRQGALSVCRIQLNDINPNGIAASFWKSMGILLSSNDALIILQSAPKALASWQDARMHCKDDFQFLDNYQLSFGTDVL